MYRRNQSWGLVVPPWWRCLPWILELKVTGVAGSQLGMPTSSTDSRKKGTIRDSVPYVLQSKISSPPSSSVVHVDTFPKNLDQWKSIASDRFVLNMVKIHNHQRRWYPVSFHNLKLFHMKPAMANHPIIQKEVNKLLVKHTTEPFTGGAGFYSTIFVTLKHNGGLSPILNLTQFDHFMHIPTVKMPAIRQVWQLLQQGYYAFFYCSQRYRFTYSYS